MPKIIVEFLQTHGRYVKGDVAGFDQATLNKWPKGVCKPHDPEAVRRDAALDGGAALAQREADLVAREAALATREAALGAAEKAPDAADDPARTASAKSAGQPPKQGAKT